MRKTYTEKEQTDEKCNRQRDNSLSGRKRKRGMKGRNMKRRRGNGERQRNIAKRKRGTMSDR